MSEIVRWKACVDSAASRNFDLLDLKTYQGIPVLARAEALREIEMQRWRYTRTSSPRREKRRAAESEGQHRYSGTR